jgi:predicted ATPase/DNA-binding SARP family transcriptional activator/Tfp pilus assembly protein PilF
MSHLSIALLGSFLAHLDGVPITTFTSVKVKALLIYLAVESGRPHHRDMLAELLWPEQPPTAGRKTLRTTLADLRRAINDRDSDAPLLEITRDTIQLNMSGSVDLDLSDVTRLHSAVVQHPHASAETCTVCAKHTRAAIDLYRGDFLAHFYLDDSPIFEDWIAHQRSQFQQILIDLCDRMVRYSLRREAYADALVYARRQLSVDPLRESAHQQVMRALAYSGQRSAALAQYETCRRLLAQELGVVPSEETDELLVQVREQTLERPPTTNKPFHILPAPLTSFLGRETERKALAERLSQPNCRLVTLTGPPGIGKTRLALAVLSDLQHAFSDGVAFVALTPLHAPELVIPSIAYTLGLTDSSPHSPLAALISALRHRELLLVLDNFEHLLAAAPQIGDLLVSCPQIKILVTSRAVLHVYGEQQFAVPPLAVPDPNSKHIEQAAAVQLFLARSQAADAGITPTEANLKAIAALCVQLDGVPLAIELAAARGRLFSPQELMAQLAQPLTLLTSAARAVEPRQQTLQHALDWSFRLLHPDEQRLFARFSVFVGGCTLEAAEAICIDHDGAAGAIMNGIGVLLDHSLLRQRQEHNGTYRFGMLHIVREYARTRLAELGEEQEIRRRHASFYLALAQAAEEHLTSAEQVSWLLGLEAEQPNFRAALQWALEKGDAELALDLSGSLAQFWKIRGYLVEGRQWLERALALCAGATPAVQARALYGVGLLAADQGDYLQSLAWCSKSLAIWETIGDLRQIAQVRRRLGLTERECGKLNQAQEHLKISLKAYRAVNDSYGTAAVLSNLGMIWDDLGQDADALKVYAESLQIFRSRGDLRSIGIVLNNQGVILAKQGAYPEARACYDESLAIRRTLGDRLGMAVAFANLGELAWLQGDLVQARRDLNLSLELSRELGVRDTQIFIFRVLGRIALAEGMVVEARSLLIDSFRVAQELHKQLDIVLVLEALVQVAIVRQCWRCAAQILDTATLLRSTLGVPLSPHEQQDYDRMQAAIDVHATASDESAEDLAAIGIALEEILRTARAIIAPSPEAQTPIVAYQTSS